MQTGKIKIDNRESDFIFNGFDKETIEYEKEQLLVGDFQYGNCVIEHKTVEDFVQSFINGHLQKQLLQQEQNYEYSFLIISGDFKRLFFNSYMKGHCSQEKIIGMITSILVRYPKTKIFQTVEIARMFNKSENRIIAYLTNKIFEKCNDGKIVTIYDTELMRSKLTKEDVYVQWLSMIDGIGINKAKKILEKWKFFELQTATIEELKQINGIGNKLAANIKKYIY